MSLVIGAYACVVRQGSRGLEYKRELPMEVMGPQLWLLLHWLPVWLGNALLGGAAPLELLKFHILTRTATVGAHKAAGLQGLKGS